MMIILNNKNRVLHRSSATFQKLRDSFSPVSLKDLRFMIVFRKYLICSEIFLQGMLDICNFEGKGSPAAAFC